VRYFVRHVCRAFTSITALRRQLYILLLVFALRYPFLYTKQCVAALYGAFSSRMLFLLIIEAKLIVVNYSEH